MPHIYRTDCKAPIATNGDRSSLVVAWRLTGDIKLLLSMMTTTMRSRTAKTTQTKYIRLTQTTDDMCIALKRKRREEKKNVVFEIRFCFFLFFCCNFCLLFFFFFCRNIAWTTDLRSMFHIYSRRLDFQRQLSIIVDASAIMQTEKWSNVLHLPTPCKMIACHSNWVQCETCPTRLLRSI